MDEQKHGRLYLAILIVMKKRRFVHVEGLKYIISNKVSQIAFITYVGYCNRKLVTGVESN